MRKCVRLMSSFEGCFNLTLFINFKNGASQFRCMSEAASALKDNVATPNLNEIISKPMLKRKQQFITCPSLEIKNVTVNKLNHLKNKIYNL